MQFVQALISLVSVLFNLFGPLLRLVGQMISAIPGTKRITAIFVPEHSNVDYNPTNYFPNGKKIKTRHDLMREYLEDPDVVERMALERMNKIEQEFYFNNKFLKSINIPQPPHIKMAVKFKGHKSIKF